MISSPAFTSSMVLHARTGTVLESQAVRNVSNEVDRTAQLDEEDGEAERSTHRQEPSQRRNETMGKGLRLRPQAPLSFPVRSSEELQTGNRSSDVTALDLQD
jgi:hypothetical protein